MESTSRNIAERINESASQFLIPLSPPEIYKLIISEAIKLIGGIHGSIILYQDGELQRVYTTSPLLQNHQPKKDGLISKVFSDPHPREVDIKDIKGISPQIKDTGIKKIIFIPLVAKNTPIGVLTIQSKKRNKTSAHSLRAFELFGTLASLAIQNTQLHKITDDAIKARDDSFLLESNLEKVNRSGLKFLASLTPREIYPLIVDEACRLVKADFGSIVLKHEGELKRVYSSLPQGYNIKNRKNGNTYQSFKEKKPLIVDISDTSKFHPSLKDMNVKTSIFIPLINRGQSIGVLTLNSKRKISEEDIDLGILKLFGSMASLAIRKTLHYDETKKALETRDLFISMASHELKTPLTTISGYIQLLKGKMSKNNTSESRWVDELYRESKRMNLLINELLEANRIKKGQLRYEFKENSLRDILGRAQGNFQFIHPNREIIFKDNLGKRSDNVICDFDKLLQVITNVTDNAAKFSPTSTPIELELGSKLQNFIIKVKDRGKGILKKDIPKIFDGFYRSNENSEEGMGLGLFLAKNIIEKHRGVILVKTKQSQGTIVEICLPSNYKNL